MAHRKFADKGGRGWTQRKEAVGGDIEEGGRGGRHGGGRPRGMWQRNVAEQGDTEEGDTEEGGR